MTITTELFKCEFIPITHNIAKCVRCGNVISILDQQAGFPKFPCKSIMNDLFKNDTVSTKELKKIVSSTSIGAAANDNECSNAEIETRYTICKGCQYFSNNTCLECGCALSRDKIYLNKLAWKDQSCPKNKW